MQAASIQINVSGDSGVMVLFATAALYSSSTSWYAHIIYLTKTTAAQNEVALSYRSVRGI